MQQTILFKAQGKPSTRPLVILTGLSIEVSSTKSLRPAKNSSISIRSRLSRALSMAWQWMQCSCTPGRIVRAMFSAKASTVVAVIILAAMWWHNISIADTLEAQRAVGIDCLLAMPWALVWAIRASRMPMSKEGGEK